MLTREYIIFSTTHYVYSEESLVTS